MLNFGSLLIFPDAWGQDPADPPEFPEREVDGSNPFKSATAWTTKTGDWTPMEGERRADDPF
jgi:hypothetical protein